VHPDDLPPPLRWEEPVWWLYERMQTQWRIGFGGRVGLDYSPALVVAQELGWSCALTLEMLQVIEMEILRGDSDGK